MSKFFLLFLVLLFGLFTGLMIISQDTIYGYLIPLDYGMTLLFSVLIFYKDLNSFFVDQRNILERYYIYSEPVEGVNPRGFFPALIYFLAGGVVLIALPLVIVTLGTPSPLDHPWHKILKFFTSQCITIGSLYVFSNVTLRILTDSLVKNLDTILQLYLRESP